MQSITKEYLVLFNAVTEAEKGLMNLHAGLVRAQQIAEEIYIRTEASSNLLDGGLNILDI